MSNKPDKVLYCLMILVVCVVVGMETFGLDGLRQEVLKLNSRITEVEIEHSNHKHRYYDGKPFFPKMKQDTPWVYIKDYD